MIMDALKHYGLSQRADLSQAINLPLRNTRRIKFTCCDVSTKHIIFGANSGSLYVYDRLTVNFQSIIPSQLGSISAVCVSRNGKQVAVANQRGAIGVVLELDSSATKEILLTELGDGTGSKGAFVTCFCWGDEDRELYVGDSKGIVSLLQLSMFMGRNILNITLNPVLLLDQQIVQIDRFSQLLLVSTHSKCVLCNTEREEFKQIGNRPRDGPYGAAFIVASTTTPLTPSPATLSNGTSDGGANATDDDDDNDNTSTQSTTASPAASHVVQHNLGDVRIFCARPGSRLWEADLDGNVLRTHQLRSGNPAVIAFKRLQTVSERRLLLVHDERQIFLIDPIASRVVLGFGDVGQIERVAVVGEEIYVFSGEQQLFAVRLEMEQRQVRMRAAVEKQDNGKKSSPFKENGVYILDHLFNNNNSNGGKDAADVTLKEALASVVRGKYGRNIRQMFLGYDQIGPERPKTLNVSKVYNNEENYNNIARVLPTDEASPAEEEEVVPRRNPPPRKMFSMSLLSDYQISEDDKTVRNLYLVYRSSTISNLNFSDRYAKIFDTYDTNTIVGLLQKLEAVMEENNEDQSRLKVIRIYFDYLKVELIWEIDHDSRTYIKQSFIEYNQTLLDGELNALPKCEACGHYLRPNTTCHYLEIGTTLVQYFWSRQEYAQCFELVQQIPYLWLTIARFYVQDRRQDKAIQCLWNAGDVELLERAATEMFSPAHWRQLLDLMLTCYNSNSLMCLNCDKLCTLAVAECNPMWQQQQQRSADNNCAMTQPSSTKTSCSSSGKVRHFYSWNYVLNVAVESGTISGKALLALLRGYDEYIPKGAIETGFFLKCLLDGAE
uniref:Hermansky-Pudlak syndrome 5 protein homolog n=1 Tax=Culex tarsalis TaxID=7177 RepID=A0A1Q3F722_CULTA